MDEVFVGATDDVVVGDGDGVDAAPTGLQDVNTLQSPDVPNLTEGEGGRRRRRRRVKERQREDRGVERGGFGVTERVMVGKKREGKREVRGERDKGTEFEE